jgi:hypothetical protein
MWEKHRKELTNMINITSFERGGFSTVSQCIKASGCSAIFFSNHVINLDTHG